MKESGIYEYWIEESLKVHGIVDRTDTEDENSLKPLTLDNLSGVFKVFIYGISLSVTVFIFEWIYYLYYNSRNYRNN